MNLLVEELSRGMPNGRELERVILRLAMASLIGAIIGSQRQRAHKPAGLRTHMLVSLGAAIFVIVPAQMGMETADLSRVIQGLATGIGFLGGGAILKLAKEGEIHGLTTAAGIWLTAGLGVAAGLGALGIAFITLLLGWVILAVLVVIESKIERMSPPPKE